ncbi:MAG: LPXTG cell wall anchor domain-containing protein, partial [Eubacteriales bacterium]|nr:LPXTG cell wall anchor domain-containing protein [Eubacteriales bacterium]
EPAPEPAAEPAPEPAPVDPVFDAAEVTGKLTIRQTSTDNPAGADIYMSDDIVIKLASDATVEPTRLEANSLPCGADLNNLSFTFTANGETSSYYTASVEADAADPNVKIISFAPVEGSTDHYKLALTLAKNAHTPNISAPTCTTPQTCTICGTVLQPAVDHSWLEATCTTPKTCSVCNATEGNALGHTLPTAATCIDQVCTRCGQTVAATTAHVPDIPAPTCVTPQICTVCRNVIAAATGVHTPGPAATCTTPQNCTVCGAVIQAALGHAWTEATCTTPKTCSRCNATEGAALGHKLKEDWTVSTPSTSTEHGEEERSCHRENCDYVEFRDLNIIGLPEHNSIANLADGGQYDLNTRLTFSAVGAGMANTKPINGDERYVPSSWTIQGTPGTFMDNFTGAFSITKAGTYTLTVAFQKQIYEGSWKNTSIADSKSLSFTVGTVIQGVPTDGSADAVRINPKTGDNTVILPIVIALAAAILMLVIALIFKFRRRDR